MNPKLVEEVALAIARADDGRIPDGCGESCKHPEVSDWSWFLAQAAIRVCAPHFAKIARDGSRGYGGTAGLGTATRVSERIEDAIKREGGLT